MKRTPGTGACLLSLILLFCVPVWTQTAIPQSTPAASQPEVPKDALGRTTPRGTVLGFLAAARKGDNEVAVQYLNTRLRGKAATDFAHQLFVVLDRRLPARLNELSDQPEGSLFDPLKPNEELVGTIRSNNNSDVDIMVERVERGKSQPLWLFSRKTLDTIPDLYEEVGVASVDNFLPEFLVQNRFAGIPLFEWLAVFVGMPLFYLLTTLLNRILSPLIGSWRRHLFRKADLPDPTVLPQPVRLLLLALVIRWLLTQISLPLLARQFWFSTAIVITIAGCVWLLILVSGWVEEYLSGRFRGRNRAGATLMLRLAGRAIDGLIIFAGVLVMLHHFGVNPTAALAGLGVGGIAVALAAQKTLENVIGGISLIFDQTVQVGDLLHVGNTLGTVDDIGLRSTRIRTLARTVVSIPNGQIANMSLENLSSRDKFWFHPILSLRYETTSPQLQTVLDSISSLLRESQYVEADSVRVNFLRLGSSSLDIEVFAYLLVSDWIQFLKAQQIVLFQIVECIKSAGVHIALPSQTIFLVAAPNPAQAGLDFKESASTRKMSNPEAESA